MKSIFILGGGGFIGKTLAEEFLNRGYRVAVYDTLGEEQFENFEKKKELIIYKGNMEEYEKMEEVLKKEKPDAIFHLVCNILPGSREDEVLKYMDLNMNSTLKLFEIMRDTKVKKLVYVSSGGAIYGANGKSINNEDDELKPINFYGWIKYAIEKYIKAYHNIYGFDYLIVRPSNPFGKYQNINGRQGIVAVVMGKVLKDEKIEIWGDGTVVRDYIPAVDMAGYVAELLDNKNWNRVYNIGSGIGKSIKEILRIIEKVSGKKLNVDYKPGRKEDITVNILDVSRIKKETGIVIEDNIEKELEQMWNDIKIMNS